VGASIAAEGNLMQAGAVIDMGIETFDWTRAIRAGEIMAVENARRDANLGVEHVMWELLREAADVSQRAYSGLPRLGYPEKSAMPDAPPEVTTWQMMAAYLRGEVEEMPTDTSTKPRPSMEQVSRSEAVLDVWHWHALKRKGQGSRIKHAVYLKACGVPDRKVRAVTGMTRQAIHAAKVEAMQDMWEFIRPHTIR